MNDTKINKELGIKWFIFFTKIRPFITFIFSQGLILDFCQNTGVYLSSIWTFMYFLFNAVGIVVTILEFFMSLGDYIKFTRFVKVALIIEAICFTYSQSFLQYLSGGIIAVVVAVCFCLLFELFVWYRLNMKYFERRIPMFIPQEETPEYKIKP